MKKKIYFAVVIFLCIAFLVSCSSESEILPTETLLVPKPSLAIKDTPMNFELPNYSKDAAIVVPYTSPLPENTEVMYNDEKVTILKFTSAIRDAIRMDLRIMVNKGIVNGKMIYRKLVAFTTNEYRYGFMNTDFSFLTDAIYTSVYPFEYGCAVVKTKEGFGVIDIEGREIMPCVLKKQPILTLNTIRVPVETIGNISRYNCYSKLSGIYMYSMKRVYDVENDSYTYFKLLADGDEEYMDVSEESIDSALIVYRDKDTGRFGYKDVFGDIIIPPQFFYAYEFYDGLARVRDKESSLYGYIDVSGKLVIPYQYSSATDFEEYIAKVTLEGKETYILTNGEQLHEIDFAVTKSYHEGLAAVIRNDESKWEYVNINGETAFPGKFVRAGNFSHGYAPVMDIYYRNYYIDRTGQPAFSGLPFEFAQEINEDGYALTEIETFVQVYYEEWNGYASTSAFIYYLIIVKD